MRSSWCRHRRRRRHYVVDSFFFFAPSLWHLSCRMCDLVRKVGLESPLRKTGRELWRSGESNQSEEKNLYSLQKIQNSVTHDCICSWIMVSEWWIDVLHLPYRQQQHPKTVKIWGETQQTLNFASFRVVEAFFNLEKSCNAFQCLFKLTANGIQSLTEGSFWLELSKKNWISVLNSPQSSSHGKLFMTLRYPPRQQR